MNRGIEVPGPHARTVCELNASIVNVTSENDPSYKLACPDAMLGSPDAPITPAVNVRFPNTSSDNNNSKPNAIQTLIPNVLQPVFNIPSLFSTFTKPFSSISSQLLPFSSSPTPPLAWHLSRPLVAIITTTTNTVELFDYKDHIPILGQNQIPQSHTTLSSAPPPSPSLQPLKPWAALQHDVQVDPSSLAWRPHAAATVAVGCRGGICLWSLERVPKLSSSSSQQQRGVLKSNAGAQLTWLQSPGCTNGTNCCTNGCTNGTNSTTNNGTFTVNCLEWHPRGHLLASASPTTSTLYIWDIATGLPTPLRAGTTEAGITVLKWSPCGSYLLVGYGSGAFRLWQTATWWSVAWSSSCSSGGKGGNDARRRNGKKKIDINNSYNVTTCSGALVDAYWSPDGRSILLAHASVPTLASLHLTGEPPSLSAQILPVLLPELSLQNFPPLSSPVGREEVKEGEEEGEGIPPPPPPPTLGVERTGTDDDKSLITSMSWDPRGQRLALSIGHHSGHPAAGCVALYDTRCIPILTARFVGFMRVGGEGEGVCGLEFKPGCVSQGALLAAREGKVVTVIPMFF